jgi:hypothetical protein
MVSEMGLSPRTKWACAASARPPSADPRKRKGGIDERLDHLWRRRSLSAKRAARVARALSSKLGLRLVFVRVVDPGSADEQISTPAERLERLIARPKSTAAPGGSLTLAIQPTGWSQRPPTRKPG